MRLERGDECYDKSATIKPLPCASPDQFFLPARTFAAHVVCAGVLLGDTIAPQLCQTLQVPRTTGAKLPAPTGLSSSAAWFLRPLVKVCQDPPIFGDYPKYPTVEFSFCPH